MSALVHNAGAPVEGVQTCTRCGYVIEDHRNVAYVSSDGSGLGFWAEGPITISGVCPRVTMSGAEDGVPLCGSKPS